MSWLFFRLTGKRHPLPFRGNRLDLDPGVLGQGGNLKGSTGGVRLGKELAVDLVHRAELVDIGQQHSRLYHICHGHAIGLQNRPQILQGLPGLGGDVFSGEGTGGGINGQLAGNKSEISGGDPLGLRADGRGSGGAVNGLVGHKIQFLSFAAFSRGIVLFFPGGPVTFQSQDKQQRKHRHQTQAKGTGDQGEDVV